VASAARVVVVPLAWLFQPARRNAHARLMKDYGRLMLALPKM
jgi:hypothetical protein